MFGRKPRLVNRRVTKQYDQSIGRDSKWGNRTPLNPDLKDADRDSVIEAHDIQLTHQIWNGDVTISDLLELEGKVLGCWCVPKRCHGHNIVRRVAWARQLQNKIDRYIARKRKQK